MRQAEIQSKVDHLLDNLEKLARLRCYSYEEFIGNFERVDSTIYRLQTSVEALLDISRYIIASRGYHVPPTSREAIERLAQQGLITETDAQQYVQMIGFRNRVVHEYNRLDYPKLYDILQSGPQDLARFLDQLLSIINGHADDETPSPRLL